MMGQQNFRLGVLGGGAWGTALGSVAARNQVQVTLWAREPDVVEAINSGHENPTFLPGIGLPENLTATGRLSALCESDGILVVSPVQYTRGLVEQLKSCLPAATPLVLCSKGIEQTSLELLSVVVRDMLARNPVLVLSGPSFAADVARDLPTAVTLAAEDQAIGARIAEVLSRPTFRIYLSDDVVGAQIGGAVKNVLAIACGIVQGKGLGESARAALMARGFAEMQRLALALGASPMTLAGLSGLGDLILTCSSTQSRNMSLGVELGQGKSIETILSSRKSVAEGVYTAQAVVALAAKYGIEMPIATAVQDIIRGACSVDEAIADLLNRPRGSEQS